MGRKALAGHGPNGTLNETRRAMPAAFNPITGAQPLP
jgi:hypothetical protein